MLFHQPARRVDVGGVVVQQLPLDDEFEQVVVAADGVAAARAGCRTRRGSASRLRPARSARSAFLPAISRYGTARSGVVAVLEVVGDRLGVLAERSPSSFSIACADAAVQLVPLAAQQARSTATSCVSACLNRYSRSASTSRLADQVRRLERVTGRPRASSSSPRTWLRIVNRNSRPMTDASCRIARRSASSRSMRAAITPRIVVGTAVASNWPVSVQPPPLRGEDVVLDAGC